MERPGHKLRVYYGAQDQIKSQWTSRGSNSRAAVPPDRTTKKEQTSGMTWVQMWID